MTILKQSKFTLIYKTLKAKVDSEFKKEDVIVKTIN